MWPLMTINEFIPYLGKNMRLYNVAYRNFSYQNRLINECARKNLAKVESRNCSVKIVKYTALGSNWNVFTLARVVESLFEEIDLYILQYSTKRTYPIKQLRIVCCMKIIIILDAKREEKRPPVKINKIVNTFLKSAFPFFHPLRKSMNPPFGILYDIT